MRRHFFSRFGTAAHRTLLIVIIVFLSTTISSGNLQLLGAGTTETTAVVAFAAVSIVFVASDWPGTPNAFVALHLLHAPFYLLLHDGNIAFSRDRGLVE